VAYPRISFGSLNLSDPPIPTGWGDPARYSIVPPLSITLNVISGKLLAEQKLDSAPVYRLVEAICQAHTPSILGSNVTRADGYRRAAAQSLERLGSRTRGSVASAETIAQ
jgi:hypothetical protein